MKQIGLFFLIICYTVLLAGCTKNAEKSPPSDSAVQNKLNANVVQNTDENIITRNCMLDNAGNFLILSEDEYVPYTYDKIPKISDNLAQIIQVLSDGNNIVKLDYNDDKLYVYYLLEENKSRIVGGNDVDIFNLFIDSKQDIISFSVENLAFPDLLDDDYTSQLQETFNLLFDESGKDIYLYFMEHYQNPVDGNTDETSINGMQVSYRCTPKHELTIYLLSDKDIKPTRTPGQGQSKQTREENFVYSIMQAINQNDLSFLIKHYDSVYEEISQSEINALPGGLKLYHEYFKGEKLVSFEYQKDIDASHDSPNTRGKKYVFTSESGIKRDIVIKCFGNEEITYKYDDPLLFYGEKTVNRVTEYIEAVKAEDIQYLYEYIRMINGMEESMPYSGPNRNKEYVAMAEKTIENYKRNFKLDLIEYKMSGNISEASSGPLFIEFVITGLSPNNEAVEHIIYGVYEFPMLGVNDSWFGDNGSGQ